MSAIDVIDLYLKREATQRSVLLLPGARHIADRMPAATPFEVGEPRSDDGAVLVIGVRAGREAAELADVAPAVGERDVLVLISRSLPVELQVGPIVQAVTAGGLRVVRAEQLEAPAAGTLLVVSRDALVRRASYLLGQPIPDDDATDLRLSNEWLVEGLQLRAADEAARQKLWAAEEILRATKAELDAVRLRVGELDQRLSARSTGLAGVGVQLRRAATVVKQDPVRAPARLARALARRARRHRPV